MASRPSLSIMVKVVNQLSQKGGKIQVCSLFLGMMAAELITSIERRNNS